MYEACILIKVSKSTERSTAQMLPSTVSCHRHPDGLEYAKMVKEIITSMSVYNHPDLSTVCNEKLFKLTVIRPKLGKNHKTEEET